jgi:hypothetical protein
VSTRRTCVFPVRVIRPRCCSSPLECSDGTRPRKAISCDARAKRRRGVCLLPPTWLPDCKDATEPCACYHEWPKYGVTLLTMVGADGLPLEPHARCIPVDRWLTTSLIWDGAQFAHLTMAGYYDVEVGTFDEDGNTVASGARPPLMSQMGAELLTAQLAAVGPNDYIIVYTLQSTGANYIARFSLVPL